MSGRELLERLQGAIAAGIRQAISDEGTAIHYHEHQATPDLDWVYANAQGIADYIATSKPWRDLSELLSLANSSLGHQPAEEERDG